MEEKKQALYKIKHNDIIRHIDNVLSNQRHITLHTAPQYVDAAILAKLEKGFQDKDHPEHLFFASALLTLCCHASVHYIINAQLTTNIDLYSATFKFKHKDLSMQNCHEVFASYAGKEYLDNWNIICFKKSNQ